MESFLARRGVLGNRKGVSRMKSFFALLSLTVMLAGCGSGAPKDSSAASSQNSSPAGTEIVAPDSKGIETVTAQASAIPEYLVLPAHVEPDPTRVVHVFAPAGGRIVEMEVKPWDRVEKGQTIAQLESSDLARAVADYHKAIADRRVKEKALERARDLLDHLAISERDFEQVQGDAQQSQAELEAAREAVQVFGMDPDHASNQLLVVAPRAGVVLDTSAAAGEFSQALSAPAPLATVADISSIWAVGDIYEQDLAAAKSGQAAQVTLDAYPGEHWTGRVSVVSGAVDPTTRTLHVRVILPNSDARIKPGMFGSIRILRSSAQGILLPAAAVIREGNDSYVFVAKGDGRFERRTVRIGRTLDGSIEIVSGVNTGESIVSEGSLLLRAAGQD
jgi:membrane fusion protein, heavy metal efflux system